MYLWGDRRSGLKLVHKIGSIRCRWLDEATRMTELENQILRHAYDSQVRQGNEDLHCEVFMEHSPIYHCHQG